MKTGEKMKLEEALFAKIAPWTDVIVDLDDVVVFKDKYPVTEGHWLFVPKEDTRLLQTQALIMAHDYGTKMVQSGDCDAFNVGMNCGIAAGQTVMYPHVHLIPRRRGDMNDPAGGVRHVIPEKAKY
jgi:diadenosine tetraphosphate (Ap4A) HIT family hydrolase